eukprot:5121206-Pyramimonas_sp.AAC.1
MRGAGYDFVTLETIDRRTDQVVFVNVWGPSRNKPPRGTAVDGWGIHFALPVVWGDPSAKINVVAQALTEEALGRHRAWKELREEPQTKKDRTSLGGAAVRARRTAPQREQ